MSFNTPNNKSRFKSRTSLSNSTSASNLNYKPSTPSSLSQTLPHKNSTPYQLLSNSPLNQNNYYDSSSPSPYNHSFNQNPTSNGNLVNDSLTSSSPIFRRNAAFGSPGAAANARASPRNRSVLTPSRLRRGSEILESSGSGSGNRNGESSPNGKSVKKSRFVRKKPLKER